MQPVATTIHEIHVVTTPSNAWVVLVDTVANTWAVYRFDRATATLSLDSTVPAPGAIEDSVGDNSDLAATDDGTLYAMIRPPLGTLVPPRIVRIANGQVTELWNDSIAVTGYTLWRLYSTGARIYTVVSQTYPVTFTAGGPHVSPPALVVHHAGHRRRADAAARGCFAGAARFVQSAGDVAVPDRSGVQRGPEPQRVRVQASGDRRPVRCVHARWLAGVRTRILVSPPRWAGPEQRRVLAPVLRPGRLWLADLREESIGVARRLLRQRHQLHADV